MKREEIKESLSLKKQVMLNQNQFLHYQTNPCLCQLQVNVVESIWY